ncbi:MAG TPA: hypothetical protein VLU25_20350 [Acidobacteriota bacterium]|nr:hypothetical protein [Acidobacteriota bacterium]
MRTLCSQIRILALVSALAGCLSAAAASTADGDRLYGRITLADGEVLEGFIRWGGTETAWVDLFNGGKRISEEHMRQLKELMPEHEEEKPTYFLGLRLDDGDEDSNRRASAVRFGQIRSIEILNRSDARLTLRSGRQITYYAGSNDMGTALGTSVIEDAEKGEVKLRWRGVERIDFKAPPQGARSKVGSRIHGVLTTEQGETFTGYITWDRDESLSNEELDGEQDGEDYSLPFSQIASIEKESRRASKVKLKDGRELVLSGTNDVDNDNRGIVVAVPEWGEVIVPWRDYRSLVLQDPEKPLLYDDFTESAPLRGTVTDESGKTYRGQIRWDNDESYTWETLDGEQDDWSYSLLFSAIESIEKTNRGARVKLRQGPTFELEDSADVDEDNNGIIVELDDGRRVLVRWKDFQQAVFEP